MSERGISARRVARFVFVAESAQPPSRRARLDTDDSLRVWWRLLAANNRVLGRSARTFASIAACRAGAGELRARIDDVVGAFSTDARGHWAWTAAIDDVVVGQSAHPYLRRIDCVRTLTLFLAGAAVADPGGADVRHFGPLAPGAGSTASPSRLPLVAP